MKDAEFEQARKALPETEMKSTKRYKRLKVLDSNSE